MSSSQAIAESIDTTGFVAGLWEIELTGKWGYDLATTDYIGGLYSENTGNQNDNNGYTESLDYIRMEPKDIAGADPSSANSGTDQKYVLHLRAFVQIAAGDNDTFTYRVRPTGAGVEAATHNIKMTMKRVSD